MRKAVWFCLPFSVCIAVCRLILPKEAVPLAALIALMIALSGLLLRGSRRLGAFLLAGGIALGSVCVWVQQRFVIDPAEKMAGERQTVSARVVDYPDLYDGSAYINIRLTQPGLISVKCRLISYVEGELDSLVPGDEITVPVRFMSASVRNGQEIDSYTSQNIFLRAVCTGEPEYTGRWRWSFLYLPQKLCRGVGELCDRIFPADAAAFMRALLTGDKTELYQDADRYYALGEAGLAHVVAVSGMHISYLMGLIYLLGGRGKTTSVIALPLLVLFAAMTGFTPSVTRAVFMQMCLLSAPLFQRENDAPTSLCVVLGLMLFFNPCAVAGAGLQLSFASMAGISLVSARIYRWLWDKVSQKKIAGWKPVRWALGFVCISVSAGLGAQIFSIPIAAAHFGYVSTVSPLSGALCLWMVAALYVGGYAAVALAVLVPSAGTLLPGILAWGVRYIYAVVRLLRWIPCEAVYMTNPLFVAWLVFVYVLFLSAWLCSRRTDRFRIVVPLCLSLITLWGCALAVRLTWSEDLRVTALDVGQGESVVLTSGPRAVMVDCGGSFVPKDAGETAVGYLKGRGRSRLDALILTHLHADHVNGAERVLSQLRVDRLYLPFQSDEDGYLPGILSAAKAAGTAVEFVTDNTALLIGDMEVTLWAPVLSGEDNENCLIVMAGQDDFEAFITGDSLSAAERFLAKAYRLPDAELLIVGHHGSDTSTCDEFLRAISPETAVISVGYNTYGHPSRTVLDRLNSYGISVLRTDMEGNITVKSR